MLGIPLLLGLLGLVQNYYGARAGTGITYDLRQAMYAHLQRLSLRFFTETKLGEIVSRFNNDVVGAQHAITGTIPSIITSLLTLLTTLAIMLTIEWRLTLLAVMVLPLFLLPARRVARVLSQIQREALEHQADMNNSISETLTINGALLVKSFGRQHQERDRFGRAAAAVRDIGVRGALVGQLFFMGLGMASAIGTALIYWAGGYMVLTDTLTTGTIVAFVAYLGRIYGPISALSNVGVDFAKALVSFDRLFDYLDIPVEIADWGDALPLDQIEGRVHFDAVSFRYQGADESENVSAAVPRTEQVAAPTSVAPVDQPAKGTVTNGTVSLGHNGVQPAKQHAPPLQPGPPAAGSASAMARVAARQWALEDVSFEIAPGQLVALVGPSGAGKTTITYLLPRLYDPTTGRILIDGQDLRTVTQASLVDQIGIVPQETYLFHDTIRANLRYAKPNASQEELDAATRAAHVYDTIAALPDGYDTIVGERGYRLSGGEKQRIAIARVILKDPRILILDEATSHLDSQNEALIQAALEPLFKGRTSLVIAHRLSTILAADQILVLDQGKLVEAGTHGALLAQGGLYTHLFDTQFRLEQEAVATRKPNATHG
ncbi:ABC transporter ATP-binding protein/permease [Chloroflexi bacterium TSY]|nr:ABC transporter ATP-binding protein/permease [Chloroflexi bacterium TSY]